jgi:hypothetical protein
MSALTLLFLLGVCLPLALLWLCCRNASFMDEEAAPPPSVEDLQEGELE